MAAGRTGRRALAAVICCALLGAGAVVLPSAAAADPVDRALGYSYGVAVTTEDQGSRLPEAQAAATATTGGASHDEEVALDVLGQAETARVEADACRDDGAVATLQPQMDRAAYLEKGGDPAQEGPEPQRRDAEVNRSGWANDRCLRLLDSNTGVQGPDNPGGLQDCASYDPAAEGATDRCSATLPLWNARGYSKVLEALGTIKEAEAEAVTRCVGGEGGTVEFMTGARYELLSGLVSSPERPNQNLNPLNFGLTSGTVVFWETNWDPTTNRTTDGSDTVWVNALHITTPLQDIVIGHAEATATCPVPAEETPAPGPTTVPPGGYPRDVTLEPSKGILRYGKTLTLSGSVTPATEFNTPRSCVSNVRVTIARDPVGGPNAYSDVATVTTDEEGKFSLNFRADRNALWIARVDRNDPQDCALETSEARPVLVRPAVSLKVSDRYVRRGRRVRFTTTIKPCDSDMPGTRVKLRRVFEGRWVKVDEKRYGSECRVVFRKKASWKRAVFSVSWPRQTEDHQSGTSRPKVVRTFRRR